MAVGWQMSPRRDPEESARRSQAVFDAEIPRGPVYPAVLGDDHHGFDPFAIKDPFPSYTNLRHDHPVKHDELIGCWVVTHWDDVRVCSTFSRRTGRLRCVFMGAMFGGAKQ